LDWRRDNTAHVVSGLHSDPEQALIELENLIPNTKRMLSGIIPENMEGAEDHIYFE
jgi:hypothetical protein